MRSKGSTEAAVAVEEGEEGGEGRVRAEAMADPEEGGRGRPRWGLLF